jgi:HEAT repeat protein
VDAAAVLGRLGADAYAPVSRLLDDDDPAVRRAALRAAARVRDPRLVPRLVAELTLPSTKQRAGAALVAIGEPAVDPIFAVLSDPATTRRVRLELPRILRGISTGHTYERLRELTSVRDDHLRLRVLAALGRLRRDLDHPPEPLSFIVERVTAELREGYARAAWYEGARPLYPSELLADEMHLAELRVTRRVLRLLELRYDRGPLSLAKHGLEDSARRGNAIELLDTMLEPALRELVVPWLDDVPVAQKLAAAGVLAGEPREPKAFLLGETESDNPFVVMVCLDALSTRPSPEVAARARALLSHPDPSVREAAAQAVFVIDRGNAAEAIAELAEDADPMVAGRVHELLSVLARNGEPEEVAMRTTLEKILVLKRAAVFGNVPAEDLAPLAHVAEEVTYEPGEVLCTEGEVGDELFVIVSGKVRVTKGDKTLATLGPGDAVGELAVLDAEPRSATVTAADETEVLAIGSEEFYEILHEQSEIAEGVLRLLTARLREANLDARGRRSIV